MPHIAYIGLGSNLADRTKYLNAAIESISSNDTSVLKLSHFYETSPVLPDKSTVHDNYLNCVIKVETKLSPEDLFSKLMDIEQKLGRPAVRQKNLPRTIDLDILFYDNAVIATHNLTIPHPELANRLFVLVPICDISPDMVHPTLKRTLKDLLKKLEESVKDQYIRRIDTD